MSAKRTRSVANLEQQENARKQTKLSWPLTSQSPSSPSRADADDVQSRSAKKSTARKPAAKKDPTPNKQYKDALKKVDKLFNGLVKRYKPNPTSFPVTADDFAAAMACIIPEVKKLRETSPAAAFNLLLDMGEHSYGDLDGSVKASGYGDTEEPFKKMDDLLLELITARRGADGEVLTKTTDEAYKVEPPHSDIQYSEEREVRRSLGKKRPNKQEWGQLDRARLSDLRNLFNLRRDRREAADDWVGNALNDIIETGGRIDQYGIGTHYFHKSIGALAEIKGIERPALARPPPETPIF
ncbi:hypothetical protein F4804DRAFT_213079 [Jackrogersella minutella]|nr:hypothetical protein F4804DRAFT_213079 [Jackrogersella minutella]